MISTELEADVWRPSAAHLRLPWSWRCSRWRSWWCRWPGRSVRWAPLWTCTDGRAAAGPPGPGSPRWQQRSPSTAKRLASNKVPELFFLLILKPSEQPLSCPRCLRTPICKVQCRRGVVVLWGQIWSHLELDSVVNTAAMVQKTLLIPSSSNCFCSLRSCLLFIHH